MRYVIARRGAEQASSFSHGNAVTVTGSGFGSGPTVSSLQAAIEATSVAAQISLSSPWSPTPAPTDEYVGFDDGTRGRAIRCLYESGGAFNMSLSWDRGSNASTDELLLFHWWVRNQTMGPGFPAEANDNGGTTAAGDDWQWKLARWRYNNDVLDALGNGDSYVAHWDNSDGSFIETSDGFHYINGTSVAPFVNGVSGRRAGGDDLPTAYTQTWSKVEWMWFMGNAGTGRTRMWVTHEGGTRNRVGDISGASFFGGGEAYRYLVLQNYHGNAASATAFNGTYVALDDVYVQRGNLRRVELTNHATLGSETWREIQTPTAWSDSSITIGALNTGANRTGALYLKVIETNMTTGADTEIGSRQITVT